MLILKGESSWAGVEKSETTRRIFPGGAALKPETSPVIELRLSALFWHSFIPSDKNRHLAHPIVPPLSGVGGGALNFFPPSRRSLDFSAQPVFYCWFWRQTLTLSPELARFYIVRVSYVFIIFIAFTTTLAEKVRSRRLWRIPPRSRRSAGPAPENCHRMGPDHYFTRFRVGCRAPGQFSTASGSRRIVRNY